MDRQAGGGTDWQTHHRQDLPLPASEKFPLLRGFEISPCGRKDNFPDAGWWCCLVLNLRFTFHSNIIFLLTPFLCGTRRLSCFPGISWAVGFRHLVELTRLDNCRIILLCGVSRTITGRCCAPFTRRERQYGKCRYEGATQIPQVRQAAVPDTVC